MNGASDHGRTIGWAPEFALWAGASLIVLSVHVGTAMWLLREPEMLAADNAPPAALMIELADMPEAAMIEENENSPDQETADASAPVEKVEEPVDEPEQEAVQDEPEPLEQEELEEELTQLDKVEVPLPAAKPKPPEPKKEIVQKERPAKKRQQDQASSKQAVQAQAQVTQSNRNAARQSASGLFASSMTPARWQSRLMAHLERRKKYPSGARSRREEGVVYVRFRIDDMGKVLSASLVKSSGWSELDNEVLTLVQRASPVPAPPPGANKTITAPVRFSRR